VSKHVTVIGWPDGFPHSLVSSIQGIALALRERGLDATAVSYQDEAATTGDVAFINERNILDALCCGCPPRWDISKPTVVWLHSTDTGETYTGKELIQKTVGICFTRREAMEKFASENGPGNYWVAPWGIPRGWTWPPSEPNPYQPNTTNLIYAGRMEKMSPVRSKILALATALPDVHIHMIADCKDGDVIRDFVAMPNINYMGAKAHGTFLHYIYYADLALDSALYPNRESSNCKIRDYLAMGTPIILDGVTGGTELIEESGCGVLLSDQDTGTYIAAVKKALGMDFPREQTREWMRDNHTWDCAVDGWYDRFADATGAA